jgi:hypothetical protein
MFDAGRIYVRHFYPSEAGKNQGVGGAFRKAASNEQRALEDLQWTSIASGSDTRW